MSEHKHPKAEGIVTSDAVQNKGNGFFSKRLKFVAAGSVIIILLALIGGILYKVYVYDPAHTKLAQPKNKSDNTFLIHPEKQLASAQSQLQGAKTQEDQAAAYYALGGAYLNNKDGPNAIIAFNNCLAKDKASTYKPGALEGLGYAYNMLGQKDKAISAFEEVISIAQQSNDPLVRGKVAEYQLVVQRLQAGQPI